MPIRPIALLFLGSLCVACATQPAEFGRVRPAQPATASAPARAAPSEATPAPSASGGITYAGGDGTSLEQAIVVLGASNSFAGIHAEYSWLQARFPGYKRRSQALLNNSGKSYDRLEVELPDGRIARFYFDITAFFGKF